MGKFTPSRSNVSDLKINGFGAYSQGADLVINNGIITVTHSMHTISGQGDVADDLNRIEGASASNIGQILILRKKGGAGGTMTVKDNVAGDAASENDAEGNPKTANINLVTHRALSNDKDVLVLVWHGATWLEISYSNNV